MRGEMTTAIVLRLKNHIALPEPPEIKRKIEKN
jgi:hypothetical protein